MSVWSLLLRVLLAGALVFNGVSTAVASVHLGHMGAMVPAHSAKVAPVQTTATEEPPCHQHHQAEAVGDSHPAPAAADTAAKSGTPSPDCCKSGACRCTCVHHAPVAIVDLGFLVPLIEHADSVRPMSTRHATPALPHLIRPPIG
jgi:hypothetical protein